MGAGEVSVEQPPARQPCPDCERVERAVIIGAAVAGGLMGAGLVFFILTRAK